MGKAICGNCHFYDHGKCLVPDGWSVSENHTCDDWFPDDATFKEMGGPASTLLEAEKMLK